MKNKVTTSFNLNNLGLDAESEDDLKQTVLYYVAREGKSKCIEYLVSKGWRPNHVDIYRQTPLYYAVRENRLEAAAKIIQLLGSSEEERRSKLNHVDGENETWLFYAVNEGHYEMTKLLVEAGVNINVENREHFTVLDIIRKKKQSK